MLQTADYTEQRINRRNVPELHPLRMVNRAPFRHEAGNVTGIG
jgi:hypothetical protein